MNCFFYSVAAFNKIVFSILKMGILDCNGHAATTSSISSSKSLPSFLHQQRHRFFNTPTSWKQKKNKKQATKFIMFSAFKRKNVKMFDVFVIKFASQKVKRIFLLLILIKINSFFVLCSSAYVPINIPLFFLML